MLLTPDGHEYTYQVNYLAHFYIVHQMLLRGLLAPDARIVITQALPPSLSLSLSLSLCVCECECECE